MNSYWRTLRMICLFCEDFSWRKVPPGSWTLYCSHCRGKLGAVYEDGHEHRSPYLR
jgi:hypothetical protein